MTSQKVKNSLSLERLCSNWQNHAFAIFVIPGLTRARSEALALSSAFSYDYVTGCRIRHPGPPIKLRAGLIRDRHDRQNLSVFLNCDTVSERRGLG
jgi:hypothetical protein